MALYVILGNLTDKGLQDLDAVRKAHDNADMAITKLGGRLVGRYYLLGQYDYVLIVDFPKDALVLRGALANASAGLTRSAAFRAFTPAEFDTERNAANLIFART
jgi:uncharacterized protein with GYD domain